MPSSKSPTIKKVFDAFEEKLNGDEKFDDAAVARLIDVLSDDKAVTAPKISAALFPPSDEEE